MRQIYHLLSPFWRVNPLGDGRDLESRRCCKRHGFRISCSPQNKLIYAPVVQRIERYFPKVEITGSNPVRGTVIVAQSVERLFVAQEVAGSSPVSHPHKNKYGE